MSQIVILVSVPLLMPTAGRGLGHETLRIGDVVEARYRGMSRWYKGKIFRVNSDGTFDIRYVDGDKECGVDGSLVRLVYGSRDRAGSDMESPVARAGHYRVGDNVEARFGGRARWFSATVERENRDGTYHLLYADGDEERAVQKDFIRLPESVRRSGSRSPGRRVVSGVDDGGTLGGTSFHVGDKIEARYKRGRKWYKGTIRSACADGTYDIRYDDGDTESGVDPGLVRAIGVGSDESLASTAGIKRESHFMEGDKVEARFGGRSQWLKAIVRRKNRDGTFDLLYPDGDEETSVGKDLIRSLDRTTADNNGLLGRKGLQGIYGSRENSSSEVYQVGDDIEARYRGGRKWYPGTIRSVNGDGTCDLRYNDGDTERDIGTGLIRKRDSTEYLVSEKDGRARDWAFSKSDKVEARFGGRSRWFKATVKRENVDGTYHLLYKDGDEERAVDKDLIRRVGDECTSKSAAETSGAGLRSSNGRVLDETDSDQGCKKHRVGDEVEARYKRGRKWYSGVIRVVNRNGTYDIRYTDGNEENDVAPSLVRSTHRSSHGSLVSSTDAQRGFAEGDKVEARYRGRSRWLKATIRRGNKDGTYHVLYDDGGEEREVERDLIRFDGQASTRDADSRVGGGTDSEGENTRKRALRVGDSIEARYKCGHKWYPGIIRGTNRGGTFDIRYKDGDVEYDVDADLVRVVSTDSLASSERDESGMAEFSKGDNVEARFGGRVRWYKARVVRRNRDGTYHLFYADGDEEKNVGRSLMRRLGGGTSTENKRGYKSQTFPHSRETHTGSGQERHRVGDEIDARYKKGSKWYPGVVRTVNRGGTYDIRYKDGDSERDVDPGMVRSTGRSSMTSLQFSSDDYVEGERVEARFGGHLRWYRAVVERKNRDGTYYLRYSDGDEEKAVDKDLIRKAESVGSPAGSKSPSRRVVSGAASDTEQSRRAYRVGDKVEARYGRGRKWYPGVIREINRDGSYVICYNDGDTEREVEPGLIRAISTKDMSSPAIRLDAEDDGSFTAGEKVEARFGGRLRWFKATVERENRNGTYHLVYDDGDGESSVTKDLIRRIDDRKMRLNCKSPGRRVVSGSGAECEAESHGPGFRVGDEIEGRYRGERKWFPGVIRAINRDGTYDIRYHDGDTEHSVEPRLIRRRGAGSVDSLTTGERESFAVGEQVEAKFRGRSRWFRARVERENSDETYNLLYADGDEEKGVDKRLMRKVERKRPGDVDIGLSGARNASLESLESSSAGGYYPGDKVEARFAGRSRWLKATVKRQNRDGTYHLIYEDDDEELAVYKDLMRTPGYSSEEGESKSRGTSTAQSRQKLAETTRFRVGDNIEARFKQGRKWYEGNIRAVNQDGTYDIRYSDGDSERGVEANLLRRINSASVDLLETVDGVRYTSSFRVGEKVEARFRGRARWFNATIDRRHRDGRYDVVYDDGDEEKSVRADLIRALVDGSKETTMKTVAEEVSSGKGSDIEIDRGVSARPKMRKSEEHDQLGKGDMVEARFGGGARWRPGTITRIHRDGTFDIAYVDGKHESYVLSRFVRRIVDGGTGSDSGKETSRVIVTGDSVEARIRGGSSWEEGSATRVHSDGTYDVRYSNGEHERRVESRLVRLGGVQARGTRHGRYERGRGSSSDTEGHSERLRRGGQHVSEVAETAAMRVYSALRSTGKRIDHLTRKLTRQQDEGICLDSRGQPVPGTIDRETLASVLGELGVELSSREARALARDCENADARGCVDVPVLISLVSRQQGRLETGERSADGRGSRPLRNRNRRFTSTASEESSEPNIDVRTSDRRTCNILLHKGSVSSVSNGSDASADGHSSRTRCERKAGPGVDRSREWSRSVGHRGRFERTSSNEQGEIRGSESSGDAVGQRMLTSRRVLKALGRLERPAFDGGLRQAFDELRGGQDGTLSRSQTKR